MKAASCAVPPIPPKTAQLHNCTTANSSYIGGGVILFLLHNCFSITADASVVQMCRCAAFRGMGGNCTTDRSLSVQPPNHSQPTTDDAEIACQCGNRKEDEMIKTETALILDTDDEWRLRQLLDSLTDFSKGLAIAEADVPEIREAVWSLQKKLKRAEAAPTQTRQATAQRAA